MWMSINLAENLEEKKFFLKIGLLFWCCHSKKGMHSKGVSSRALLHPSQSGLGTAEFLRDPQHLLIHQSCLCCCGGTCWELCCACRAQCLGDGCSAGAAEASPRRDVCAVCCGTAGRCRIPLDFTNPGMLAFNLLLRGAGK